MRLRTRKVLRALGTFVGIIAISSVHVSLAQEMSSESFRIQSLDVDQFGGYSTSTSFSNIMDGGYVTSGQGTSTSFSSDFGPLNFDSYTPATQNWRWYDDEENETPGSALAAEDTAPTNIESGNTIKLRITVKELAGIGSTNQKFRLQFATSSDFSGGGYDVAEIPVCMGASQWCYALGGGDDNALITTGLLSDADSCVVSVGDGCGTHNESATTTTTATHVANAATEYEFTLVQNGALSNTTYFFRLMNHLASTSVPINTGESYPSLVTGGTSLTFSISGISSGVGTEGVTTDVTTTPTSVPFGTLAADAEVEGAQRLTITTNATNGYKIWAFQRQALMNERAQSIDPVSGTNASPVGWSSGCSGSSFGCYGYHTGEDVLEGGSTRFSANDTYAQFNSTVEEVGYASLSVNDKTTDVVYKIEVKPEQYDGSYSSSVVYVIVPVF